MAKKFKYLPSDYYFEVVAFAKVVAFADDGSAYEPQFVALTRKSFYKKNKCMDDTECGDRVQLPPSVGINLMEAYMGLKGAPDKVRADMLAAGFEEKKGLGGQTKHAYLNPRRR